MMIMTLSNRPKEGDLIFFPLGKRMFEIKFVEHERPFYQLQKITFINYNVNSLNMKMKSLIQMSMQLMKLFKLKVILQD